VILVSSFGTDVCKMFLATSWPNPDPDRIEWVKMSEAVTLFLENADPIRAAAHSQNREWSPIAVEEVDLWLIETAETGQFMGDFALPPIAAEELWRRWQYMIVGGLIESNAGTPLDIPVPMDAPDALKGMAVMLYCLAGPAREYPPDMY
jgi:hypothetical protein